MEYDGSLLSKRYTERYERGRRAPGGYESHGEGFGLHSKGNTKPVEGLALNGHRHTSPIIEGWKVERPDACWLVYLVVEHKDKPVLLYWCS